MMTHPIKPAPSALNRARLDNIALVPGSLLPSIERCQQMANTLPRGAALIVVPSKNPAQKQALLAVAKLLAAEGHQVRVVSEEEFSRLPSYVQSSLDL
jgi:hypothetical protein